MTSYINDTLAAPTPLIPALPPIGALSGFPVVALGAADGGPAALVELFSAMPVDTGMAFILVALLDPSQAGLLPELLQKSTAMPVSQVSERTRVEPDNIYLISANLELKIREGVLEFQERSLPESSGLPIDTFFRSLAEQCGERAISIVLSGTGSDGALGIEAIKKARGLVLVQDETAEHCEMPHSAIATKLADHVLPAAGMPAALLSRAFSENGTPAVDSRDPADLEMIYRLLLRETGHDFASYKTSTIFRRVERRMSVNHIDHIHAYTHYLEEDEREIGLLFKDLLIGVTNFFRNPAAFDSLQQHVEEHLIPTKKPEQTLRVWVPACSTGEEAYSLAILLHELMGESPRRGRILVFATDIDEAAIAVARAGKYPARISADVSPTRLQNYFDEQDDGSYRIKKIIREMLIFAPQNMLSDPPFTKLDILSCRNLLIYLDAAPQKKLLPMFHYALNPGGVLFLGSSETVRQAPGLFEAVDSKWKLYVRSASSDTSFVMFNRSRGPRALQVRDITLEGTVEKLKGLSALKMTETVLQESAAAPCVIVNTDNNIVFIHGNVSPFLRPPEGLASINVLDMAQPSLRSELSGALRNVHSLEQAVTFITFATGNNGEGIELQLTIKPIPEHTAGRGLVMVVFRAQSKDADHSIDGTNRPRPRSVEQLTEELRSVKKILRSTIATLEVTNEELQTVNEELQPTNEELQSTNEEMETSKEELQSMNEESETVNAELQSRNDDLTHINDDLKNLLDSTETATIFLDKEFRVGRFTSGATSIIPLVPADAGRHIGDFACRLVDTTIEVWATQVLDTLVTVERAVRTEAGRRYRLRIRPYRTSNNAVDGVVITFDDTTTQMKLVDSLETSERMVRLVLQHTRDDVHTVDRDGTILYSNRPNSSEQGEAPAKRIFDVWPEEFHEATRATLRRVFESGIPETLDTTAADSDDRAIHSVTQALPIWSAGKVTSAILITVDQDSVGSKSRNPS